MATKSDRKRRVAEKYEFPTLYQWLINLLGLGFGCFHRWHVSTLFENDRHFSHLSEMEREMSFRTEMGMYYSYYKIIAESNNFSDGMEKLCHDNLSEYDNVIDVTKKYNVLPETLAGFLYHIVKKLGIISQAQCWQILTKLIIDLFGATICSLCTWQFSHFVFTTQIIAILILKWLKIIPNEFYRNLSIAHILAILGAIKISNGALVLCSIYACIIFSSNIASFIVELFRFQNIKREIVFEIAITILITKWIKSYLLYSQDDAHVFNILKSKLTNYRDFHTMLYTCSAEFDFLQYKTYEAIIKTLLLPTAILVGMLVLYYWYRNSKTSNYPFCIEADMAYNGLQTGAFIIMAVFIMRLKLFMTPHLCIIAGAACSKRYLEKIGLKGELMRLTIVILLLGGMSYHGIDRFQEERGFIGEFGNIEQEELFEWIKNNTSEQAVFAGKMSLMANLMLSTRRPIVNNPYYESKKMRDKTLKVYEIFSRKDAVSVYTSLKNMKVNYVVLEKLLCLGFAKVPRGCQMIDLWDMTDNGAAKEANKPPLCPLLFRGNAYPFKRVFFNNNFVVLQLDYSHYVEFKPKTSVPLHYQF
ncbi:Protein dumpy-19 [Cyphomyrmex costatus]|uniref:Protein dumpy-19 n=1 Tax=Cyphomyrmex costatus TaxID=456900 RepID=A0A151IF24_9HYME|nr:Protein dumpy-19 [Cyphomyrmex costatus]